MKGERRTYVMWRHLQGSLKVHRLKNLFWWETQEACPSAKDPRDLPRKDNAGRKWTPESGKLESDPSVIHCHVGEPRTWWSILGRPGHCFFCLNQSEESSWSMTPGSSSSFKFCFYSTLIYMISYMWNKERCRQRPRAAM
uniref:Uncharacterized protein n=1 Tax=Engystomops pustulosus TaxID=76066 RepID=A0AAV6YRI3_ENGPU|nr:hypothetical protein GDO81_023729 [Engystomops pustulosus]